MPTYMYKAMTQQGQIVKNRIEDASRVSCIKKLRRNGLVPISVVQSARSKTNTRKKPRNYKRINDELKKANKMRAKEKSRSANSITEKFSNTLLRKKKITTRDIKIFTQNFYLLKKANFNNVHALSVVMENTENPRLKLILEDILYGVESGEFMYTTMEYYYDVFPYIYINMIRVGELSGSLEKSLGQAIKYLDENDALVTKLKRILIPNIAMFVGLLLMLFVCVIVGVPAIQNIFESLGTTDELPWITLWFAGVVNKLVEIWYVPLIAIVGCVLAFIVFINNSDGRYKFDGFKYRMPIFGKLLYLMDFSRLTKNMLLNIENGIRIQDALEVSKNVIKNTVMLSMADVAINNIYVGKSWIEPFEEAKFSNSMTVEMLKIGMQTDLTEMMGKLIEYMDIDIDNTLERITKLLPEISYAVVGSLLIFFVIVVLVPCIQIYMGGFLFSAYGF